MRVVSDGAFYQAQLMKTRAIDESAGGRGKTEESVKPCQLSVQGLPRRGMRVMWPGCILLRNRPIAVAR
jgi:hypothetical protein